MIAPLDTLNTLKQTVVEIMTHAQFQIYTSKDCIFPLSPPCTGTGRHSQVQTATIYTLQPDRHNQALDPGKPTYGKEKLDQPNFNQVRDVTVYLF